MNELKTHLDAYNEYQAVMGHLMRASAILRDVVDHNTALVSKRDMTLLVSGIALVETVEQHIRDEHRAENKEASV